MAGVYELTASALLEAIQEELMLRPKEDHLAFYQYAVNLRLECRLYFLGHDMARDKLWPELRHDERLLDLVVKMTQGFVMRLTGSEVGDIFDDAVKAASMSIGGMSGGKRINNTSIIDQDFSQLMENSVKLRELLTQERWLLFLVVLERNVAQFLPLDLLTPMARMEYDNANSTD